MAAMKVASTLWHLVVPCQMRVIFEAGIEKKMVCKNQPVFAKSVKIICPDGTIQ